MKLFDIELSLLKETDIFTIVLYMLFCITITISGYILSIKFASYQAGFPITSMTVIEDVNPLPSNTVLPQHVCITGKKNISCLQGGNLFGDAKEFKEFKKAHSVYRFIELDSVFSILVFGFVGGLFVVMAWWGFMLKLLLPHLLDND